MVIFHCYVSSPEGMLDQLDQSLQLRNYVYAYVDMILESRVQGLVFSAYYVSALGMLVQRTM